MADDLPLVFEDGHSWACVADINQYPESCAGFGDTVEEAVREYRRDMGFSEAEIQGPVVEGEHFEYR
jgi:hypothetical protein